MVNSPDPSQMVPHHRTDFIHRQLNVARRKRSHVISIQNIGLSFIPSDMNTLGFLQTVDFSHNDLGSRDIRFDYLPLTITSLNLSHNNIHELSESIGRLCSLTNLNLSNNALKTLPVSMNTILSLRSLNLNVNLLDSLPYVIAAMKNLEALSCVRNDLEFLPDWLCTLRHLKSVNFSLNRLISLPHGMDRLVTLEYIDVTHNNLRALPIELGTMRLLRTVLVDSNPLVEPPVEICDRGTAAILEHLRYLPEEARMITELEYRVEELEMEQARLREETRHRYVSMLLPSDSDDRVYPPNLH